MPIALKTRSLTLAALALSAAAAMAQLQPTGQPKPSAATLPDTAPTAIPEKPKAPLLPGQQRAHRATVTWATGQLTVKAENSSLNQILREISRQTGMIITGGVADERVYGIYGPADPGRILDDLLDGTGSNMLLMQNDANAPAALILTPRHGGATPPSPSSIPNDDDDQDRNQNRNAVDLPPQALRPGAPPAPPPPPAAAIVQPATVIAPGAAPTDPAASAATTTDQSPNGVKTPDQIYQQLLQMQQRKAAAAASPPTGQ